MRVHNLHTKNPQKLVRRPGINMTGDCARLKKTRTAYRGVLTKTLNCLKNELSSTPRDKEKILAVADRVQATEAKIDELQKQLEECIPEDELEGCIEEYCEWKDEIKFMLDKVHNSNNCNKTAKDTGTGERNNIRLPKLDLPAFSGDFLEWQMFHDSFLSSVHNRNDIADIDKFNYLRSQLRGKALDLIRGFSLSSENYKLAYNLLCERFGKKSLIIRAHIQKLLNLQYVQGGNIRSLTEFINSVEINVRSLSSLGISSESYSCFLVQIVLQRLPPQMNTEFARHDRLGESDINDLLTFLNDELTILQSSRGFIGVNKTKRKDIHDAYTYDKLPDASSGSNEMYEQKRGNFAPLRSSICQVVSKAKMKCLFCDGDYWIDQCPSFLDLSVHDRNNYVKTNKLCFNCLKPHMIKFCKSKFSCKKCHKRHHTLLHIDTSASMRNNVHVQVHTEKCNDSADTTPTLTNTCTSINSCTVSVMSTAEVRINGSSKCYRALFDSGSQLSFVRKGVIDELHVKPSQATDLNISTFGSDTSSTKRYPVVEIRLSNKLYNDKCIEMNCVVVDKVCNAIECHDLSEMLKNFSMNHQLADDISTERKAVDMIIGCDYMYEIISLNSSHKFNELYMTDTLFGFIVHGRASTNTPYNLSACNLIQLKTPNENLNVFWENEKLGIDSQISDEKWTVGELKALSHFEENVRRDNDGRYVVSLPWKEEYVKVETLKPQALIRYQKVLRKLKENSAVQTAYNDVFSEYNHLGMIEKVTKDHDGDKTKLIRYLPHHPVVKQNRSTTKVRPVFDASASDNSGLSLNDMLLPGPNLLPELFGILIRFRRFPITLTADIEKAFLQIKINDDDRDALRFFWDGDDIANENQGNVSEYRWTRLPFGLTCSPFLLNVVVKRILKESQSLYPETVEKISENIYVDDLVISVPDEQSALDIKKNSTEIFKSCSMNLRKWNSNVLFLSEEKEMEETKILGQRYLPKSDNIKIAACPFSSHLKITKRSVLQTVSSIFDPLGLISPFLTTLKLFLQRIMKSAYKWDDELSEDLKREWLSLAEQITKIDTIEVCRSLNLGKDYRIHLFCDASLVAYGAVVYVSDTDNYNFRLIAAKSRVAPSQRNVTLPRLELMAACIGSMLLKSVCTALDFPIDEAKCWSDSKIVLTWIKQDVNNLKQFVSNRVKIIQQNTKEMNWHYIRSKYNPADIVSRGCTITTLQSSMLWWQGPSEVPSEVMTEDHDAMTKEEINSFENDVRSKSSDCPNQSLNILANNTSQAQSIIDVERFSSWRKLLRVTAYVLRFIKNCRKSSKETSDHLTRAEIIEAEQKWIKVMQREIKEEFLSFENNTERSSRSRLTKMSPFIDADGFVRSKTRLQHSDLELDAKCPLILDNQNAALKLLILHLHQETLHGGVQSVTYKMRQKFVFFRMIRIIKSVVRNCMVCRKLYLKPYSPPTPALPEFRVKTTNRVFECVGTDCTGPLYVKRNNAIVKVYALLFTCTVFRAIHLELVDDLTATELMNGFKLFFARRGVPRLILSDNAKSFMKCKELLNPVIEWRMIPEKAPWFGGFWERLMTIIKIPLRKTLGNSLISHRDMCVLLSQVEAVVNDRPLTVISSDLRDPLPLTPNHFLFGKTSDESNEPLPVSSRVDHHLVRSVYSGQQTLLTHFCNRFKREYFTSLKQLATGNHWDGRRVGLGNLVLLRSDQAKCFNWPLGRVTKLYPGRDGITRVVLVESGGVTLRRAVSSLVPLELDEIMKT